MKTFHSVLRRRWLLIGFGALCLLAAFAWVWTAFRPQDVARIDSFAACREAGYPVLDSDPPVCRVGARNFTGPASAPAPSLSPATSLPFELLVDGDTHQAVPPHGQHVITSPAEWTNYWRDVHAGLATVPPLIPVDFTTSDVVGVSLGQQASGGYGLKITDISKVQTGTVVSLTESTPTITCKVTQSLTNRYLIVRTSKLAQPVSFRITTEKRRC